MDLSSTYTESNQSTKRQSIPGGQVSACPLYGIAAGESSTKPGGPACAVHSAVCCRFGTHENRCEVDDALESTPGPRVTEMRCHALSSPTRWALTEPSFRDISPAVPMTEIAVVPTYGLRNSGLSDARAMSSRTCEHRGLASSLPIDMRKHNGWC